MDLKWQSSESEPKMAVILIKNQKIHENVRNWPKMAWILIEYQKLQRNVRNENKNCNNLDNISKKSIEILQIGHKMAIILKQYQTINRNITDGPKLTFFLIKYQKKKKKKKKK